ncbi:hypothetical protein BHM03_00009226, partial [Ensete ventricosum]
TWEKRSDMAGAAPPPKQDELVPHPVKDQLANVSFCITSPPPWRKLFVVFYFCSFLSFLIFRFLSPLSAVPLVALAGFGLYELGFPGVRIYYDVAKCVEIGLPPIVLLVIFSQPFVAGFVAFLLDNTLHRHDSAVRKDRGFHWWQKFRSFKGDTRSEEFYSLPCNLNKFFPSV